jgi:hypothetical protein
VPFLERPWVASAILYTAKSNNNAGFSSYFEGAGWRYQADFTLKRDPPEMRRDAAEYVTIVSIR